MTTTREIRSEITSRGRLKLSLEDADIGEPGPGDVVVRIEASPINPADLWLLLGPANLAELTADGSADRPVLTAPVPERLLGVVRHRLDQSLPVGNEGAGTVVEAGADVAHLLGKKVAMAGGGMWTQHRRVPGAYVLPLPDDASAEEGAASFVNPMTVLCMVEAMRSEGHSAIVHTAAASNLGHMLNRVCLADGIPLVNVVRRPEQADELRAAGATHVVDSSAATFEDDLTAAVTDTGATLAFDAVGGGTLADVILRSMEKSLDRDVTEYSAYGTSTLKQVYIYGSLDRSPTTLTRTYGMGWAVGGFLLTWFLQRLGPEGIARLRGRVARELRTTFASRFAETLSLTEALQPETLRTYEQRATGQKRLIDPSRG